MAHVATTETLDSGFPALRGGIPLLSIKLRAIIHVCVAVAYF